MPRNGTVAPDFKLTDSTGKVHSLTELRRDKPLLLLFFRGAFCPTACRDLQDYANISSRIKGINASIVAISTESVETAQELKKRLHLPFPLLSDPDFSVSETYGVYRSDDTNDTQPHGEPALFILDIDGKIAYSQVQTGPKGLANAAEIALIFLYMFQNDGRY